MKKNNSLRKLMLFCWCFLFLVLISQYERQMIHGPQTFGKTHFISGFSDYSLLEPAKKTKHQVAQKTNCKVLFSPAQAVLEQLCEFIQEEQTKICVAVYTLTDTKIAKALIEAEKRGVIVEIITDRSSPLDRATKIGMLSQAGIPIFLYQPPLEKNVQKGLMHNKFALFFNNKAGKEFIWHGSFNFTRSGYTYNCESIVLLEDHALFSQFFAEFERIKQKSVRYTPH